MTVRQEAPDSSWEAPRAAWTLARETASGRSREAAAHDIPPPQRPHTIIALGAQVRSFLAEAALRRPVVLETYPLEQWTEEVPCAPVRQLAADALSGAAVRIPVGLCMACTLSALAKMTAVLMDAMVQAGHEDLPAVLDSLATRARLTYPTGQIAS